MEQKHFDLQFSHLRHWRWSIQSALGTSGSRCREGDTKQEYPKLIGLGSHEATAGPVVRLSGRWWRQQLSLKDSHQKMQLTEGTAMTATESRFVLDDVADVFQLFVTHAAFVEPLLPGDVDTHRWGSS